MKKYGEVIGSEKRRSIIRIYKEKHGELYPTSLTVIAKDKPGCNMGDMVELEMNMLLFYTSTILGYLMPFVTTALAFFIIAPFTDNILLIEAVILTVLLLTYICARFFSSLPFFKKIPVCSVTDIVEVA